MYYVCWLCPLRLAIWTWVQARNDNVRAGRVNNSTVVLYLLILLSGHGHGPSGQIIPDGGKLYRYIVDFADLAAFWKTRMKSANQPYNVTIHKSFSTVWNYVTKRIYYIASVVGKYIVALTLIFELQDPPLVVVYQKRAVFGSRAQGVINRWVVTGNSHTRYLRYAMFLYWSHLFISSIILLL